MRDDFGARDSVRDCNRAISVGVISEHCGLLRLKMVKHSMSAWFVGVFKLTATPVLLLLVIRSQRLHSVLFAVIINTSSCLPFRLKFGFRLHSGVH